MVDFAAAASFAIPPLDPAARALAVAGAGAAAAALRELAPDMGAYVNEVSPFGRLLLLAYSGLL